MTYSPARRQLILHTVACLVEQLFDDRERDESLPTDSIQEALEEGELTVGDIINEFAKELRKTLK